MTFEVPASKASVGQDKFDFSIAGKKYSVRKLKYVPIGQRSSISHDGEAQLEFFGVDGTKQGDAVRGLDEEQFKALVEAWQADSEVTVGESEASSS
jgi:hypothetical protein